MIVELDVQEDKSTLSFWGHSEMYTPGTIADSQTERVSAKINIGAVAKVTI